LRRALSIALFSFSVLWAAAAFGDPSAFRGEILRIDPVGKSIVVSAGEPATKRKFFLARGAEVTQAGQPLSFRDLKRGATVEVSYTKQNSALWASEVAVVSGGIAEAQ
jgi:hypothetical protein